MRMRMFQPVLLFAAVIVTACTTTPEPERPDLVTNRKIDTLNSTLTNELRDVRKDLRTQDQRQQEMAKSLDALKTVVYSQVDTLGRAFTGLERELKSLLEDRKHDAQTREQLSQEHHEFETFAQAVREALGNLTPLATALDAQMDKVTSLVRETYSTELKALRERLKMLEGLARDLTREHVEKEKNGGESEPSGKAKSGPRS